MTECIFKVTLPNLSVKDPAITTVTYPDTCTFYNNVHETFSNKTTPKPTKISNNKKPAITTTRSSDTAVVNSGLRHRVRWSGLFTSPPLICSHLPPLPKFWLSLARFQLSSVSSPWQLCLSLEYRSKEEDVKQGLKSQPLLTIAVYLFLLHTYLDLYIQRHTQNEQLPLLLPLSIKLWPSFPPSPKQLCGCETAV